MAATKWGKLSPKTRARYARAGKKYGLERGSVAKRYNRNTYNPGSKGILRIPREFRNAELADLAWKNMRAILGNFIGWKGTESDDFVHDNLSRASDEALLAISQATENELTAWAAAGASDKLSSKKREQEALDAHPGWGKKDVGFWSNRKWHSIFWYHG